MRVNGGRWRAIRSFSGPLKTISAGSINQPQGVHRPSNRGQSTRRGGSIDQAPMNAKGGRWRPMSANRGQEGHRSWGSIYQETADSPLSWLVGWVGGGAGRCTMCESTGCCVCKSMRPKGIGERVCMRYWMKRPTLAKCRPRNPCQWAPMTRGRGIWHKWTDLGCR
jgi:hypothetical protein